MLKTIAITLVLFVIWVVASCLWLSVKAAWEEHKQQSALEHKDSLAQTLKRIYNERR